MERLRLRRLAGLVACVVAVLIGVTAHSAFASTTLQDISSAGPLTNVYLGNDLDCQVMHTGDTDDEFYPPDTTTTGTPTPGDCGTFVSTGGNLYGPDFTTNNGTATPFSPGSGYTAYTVGTQGAVAGAGTAASPYSVTTTATAGASGIAVSQTDSYIVGKEYYRTDITLYNTGGATATGLLYHAADCYLQGSDQGYGELNAAAGAPACTATANDSPPGQVEEFAPLIAGNHLVETYYGTVWQDIAGQTDLPGTCDCTTFEDNGGGINWDFSIPAGGAVEYSLLTNFSTSGVLANLPVGATPPTIAGATLVGSTLTEGHGTWANSPTSFGYQWFDCNTAGAGCTPINGATGQTYALTAADVGHTIRVTETGVNANGNGGTQISAQTALVIAPAPVKIATAQSAARHKAKASISIPAGLTGETDHATLTGANAAGAGGTVTYNLYRNKSCAAGSVVIKGSPRTVTAGKALASAKVTKVLKQGRYYWQVSYSGDAANEAGKSSCGSEVLHVTSPVTVKSVQRSRHTLTARMACGVVPCALAITVKAYTGHKWITLATGNVKLKKRGLHTESLPLTGGGFSFAQAASGRVKLRFVITDRVNHAKLTSASNLKAALG